MTDAGPENADHFGDVLAGRKGPVPFADGLQLGLDGLENAGDLLAGAWRLVGAASSSPTAAMRVASDFTAVAHTHLSVAQPWAERSAGLTEKTEAAGLLERTIIDRLPPATIGYSLPVTKGQQMLPEQITLADIYAARQRIAGRVRRTSLVDSPALAERTGVAIKLKREQRQTTGSFKLRGATNALLKLLESAAVPGVVACSTGNHGRALAYAARLAAVRCIICVSRQVPGNKVEAIRTLGADVRIAGESQDEAQMEVDRLAAEEGLVAVSPFDHPDIIAGQGTIGLELMEDFPELASVLVPLSGGGLISGIALAVENSQPRDPGHRRQYDARGGNACQPAGGTPGRDPGTAHARRLARRWHRPQ